MTGADKANSDAWARKRKVSYPYAYDYSFTLAGPFNVNVLPVALLVDPSGTVVYHGDARKLPEALIRKHLPGALSTPLHEWPASCSTALEYFHAGEEGMALAALEVAVEDKVKDAELWLKEFHKLLDARVRAVSEFKEAGDYLSAQEEGERLLECLSGRPWEEGLGKELEAIAASKDAQRVIEGQKKVREIRRMQVTKRAEGEAVIAKLDEVMKAYSGTAAAGQARVYKGLIKRVISAMK